MQTFPIFQLRNVACTVATIFHRNSALLQTSIHKHRNYYFTSRKMDSRPSNRRNLCIAALTQHETQTLAKKEERLLNRIYEGLVEGHRACLAEAITLIESTHMRKRQIAQVLLQKVLSHHREKEHLNNGKPLAFRIGQCCIPCLQCPMHSCQLLVFIWRITWFLTLLPKRGTRNLKGEMFRSLMPNLLFESHVQPFSTFCTTLVSSGQ